MVVMAGVQWLRGVCVPPCSVTLRVEKDAK